MYVVLEKLRSTHAQPPTESQQSSFPPLKVSVFTSVDEDVDLVETLKLEKIVENPIVCTTTSVAVAVTQDSDAVGTELNATTPSS